MIVLAHHEELDVWIKGDENTNFPIHFRTYKEGEPEFPRAMEWYRGQDAQEG